MSGVEWVVEAHGCRAADLRSLDQARVLFARMFADLNLRQVGETQWHCFPGTSGITGLALLAESHLAFHSFPEHESLCLNLFCCVPRPEWNFAAALKDLFGASTVHVRRLERAYAAQSPGIPLSNSVQPTDLREER